MNQPLDSVAEIIKDLGGGRGRRLFSDSNVAMSVTTYMQAIDYGMLQRRRRGEGTSPREIAQPDCLSVRPAPGIMTIRAKPL